MPPERAAADAWARGHGHRDIIACTATPLAAFLAGMAAERERCAQLAESHEVITAAAGAIWDAQDSHPRPGDKGQWANLLARAALKAAAPLLRNPTEGTPDATA